MAMTQATTKVDLHLVTTKPASAVLPPKLVTLAKHGAALKAMIAKAEKELKGMEVTFETFFAANGTESGTDAKGTELVRVNHGNPNRLNQKALTEAHPKIVAEFTAPAPWSKVGYV
jgi:hypothetical protein